MSFSGVDPSDLIPLADLLELPAAPSRPTVLRAIRAHKLRAAFVGRGYRCTRDDFDTWLRARCRPAPAAPASIGVSPEVRRWAERVLVESPPPPLAAREADAVAQLLVQAGRGRS